MHQTKKGNQWHFGMKCHTGVDAGSGFVHTVGFPLVLFVWDCLNFGNSHFETAPLKVRIFPLVSVRENHYNVPAEKSF